MLSCIVAMSENRVIGRDGDLPWHLPADLKRFKQLTMGHHIIMGRKTYESIGRPLPGRTNVVVTRDREYTADGVEVVHSLEEAIERTEGDDEAFVTGGEAIYRLALPSADRLYVTAVHSDVEGDVYFPGNGVDGWRLTMEEPHEADDRHAHRYTFRVYER